MFDTVGGRVAISREEISDGVCRDTLWRHLTPHCPDGTPEHGVGQILDVVESTPIISGPVEDERKDALHLHTLAVIKYIGWNVPAGLSVTKREENIRAGALTAGRADLEVRWGLEAVDGGHPGQVAGQPGVDRGVV